MAEAVKLHCPATSPSSAATATPSASSSAEGVDSLSPSASPQDVLEVEGFAKVGVKDVLEGKPTAEASKLNEEVHEIQTQPEASQDAKPKGKGKGGKGKAPPPKAKPKARVGVSTSTPPKAAPATGGMSALLQRVSAIGEKKDREEAKEIGDIDLSQIDPTAARERVKCPRCEKDVLEEHLASHMTAHSSEILPWLFLGGKRNLENDQELTVRTGITHVLNLANDVNPHQDTVDLVTKYNEDQGLPFLYKKLDFGDTRDQDILKELDGALQFIHDAKTGDERHHVLVNCAQGVSRSASVTIAYLMKYEGMSLRGAYDHVLERRTIADPRKEFLDQLGVFECQLYGFAQPTLTGEEIFANRNLLNVDDDPLPSTSQQVPVKAADVKIIDEAASVYLRFCYTSIAQKEAGPPQRTTEAPPQTAEPAAETPEGQLLEAADAKNKDQAVSSYLRLCYSAGAQKEAEPPQRTTEAPAQPAEPAAEAPEGQLLEAADAKNKDQAVSSYLRLCYSAGAQKEAEPPQRTTEAPAQPAEPAAEAPEGQLLEAADAKNRDQAVSSYLRLCYSTSAQKEAEAAERTIQDAPETPAKVGKGKGKGKSKGPPLPPRKAKPSLKPREMPDVSSRAVRTCTISEELKEKMEIIGRKNREEPEAAEDTSFEEISNKTPKRVSVTDWYEENPTPEGDFSKTTSEWYLDGAKRPSTRSPETICHSLTEQD